MGVVEMVAKNVIYLEDCFYGIEQNEYKYNDAKLH